MFVLLFFTKQTQHMSDLINAIKDIFSTAIGKWGNKIWFQVVFIIYVILFPIGIFGYLVHTNHCNRNQDEVVISAIEEREERKKEQHIKDTNLSRKRYIAAREKLDTYLKTTNSDYIFYVEYHNGTENISTWAPFNKFDVTLEVTSPESKYVSLSSLKDGFVSHYTILEKIHGGNVYLYSIDEIKETDQLFYNQMMLRNIDATEVAFINLFNVGYDDMMGTLVFINTNKNRKLVKEAFYSCARDIEIIFKSR